MSRRWTQAEEEAAEQRRARNTRRAIRVHDMLERLEALGIQPNVLREWINDPDLRQDAEE